MLLRPFFIQRAPASFRGGEAARSVAQQAKTNLQLSIYKRKEVTKTLSESANFNRISKSPGDLELSSTAEGNERASTASISGWRLSNASSDSLLWEGNRDRAPWMMSNSPSSSTNENNSGHNSPNCA
ncbi:hypothetical protein CEXT_505701 [Caerostris extrusa]|uniref:Uncharacterized protein n=1 Tax=Caerostris extrusa TaxID=172846 RepID=A0AAV4MIQ5_CAEEX|nr:hypothetical protein CEXT_505701 [Caerostris extrusa]